MIQALINNQTTTAFAFTVQFYLNLADKIVGTPTFTTTTIGDDTYYAMSFPYFLTIEHTQNLDYMNYIYLYSHIHLKFYQNFHHPSRNKNI